jgi:hypothetical protein
MRLRPEIRPGVLHTGQSADCRAAAAPAPDERIERLAGDDLDRRDGAQRQKEHGDGRCGDGQPASPAARRAGRPDGLMVSASIRARAIHVGTRAVIVRATRHFLSRFCLV